jgi:SAM-dependent methyltransferase
MKAKVEMDKNMRLNYGNWVPSKFIYAPAALAVGFLLLAGLHWAYLIVAFICLVVAVYFAVARFRFSPLGGNIQDQIQDLILANLEWPGSGKVLDVGCGNGPLSIKIAGQYPLAEVKGVDFWGKNWDYSKSVCDQNAGMAGVAERVSFQHASASALPFEDASFDLVVSNLVFHEVQDARDKRQVVREALRVLKPGGVFVLQDLFLLQTYYGKPDELVDTVRGWGVHKVEFVRTCDEIFIPKFLKLPFMVGTIAILKGVL